MPTPFDSALAELQGILVDLDGDGQPDAVMPQNAMAQAGGFPQMVANNPQGWGNAPPAPPQNAMAAAQAPMSPGMAAVNLIRNRAPQEAQSFVEQLPQNAMAMAAGPVLGGIGKAAAAYPAASAAIMGGAGLLTSASDAGAPKLTKSQRRQMEMERMRLEAEGQAAAQRMQAETEALKARGANDAEIAVQRQKQEAELAEYEAAVKRAEMARDNELGRERRFSDTWVGKGMDAMGGLAPAVAGMAVGAASRMATGGGSVAKNYLLPGALGATGGITAANVPLAYNSLYTDPDNPEKAAYQAYSRELPPTHPRKKEFGDYAAGLPDKNPVREHAAAEFYDPPKLAERAVLGGVEGVAGGLVGADAVRMLGRGASAVGNAMSRWSGRPQAVAPEVLVKHPDGSIRTLRGRYASPPK
jgi:hypothetical protein